MGAMQDIQKPIRSLAPKAGAAALTNSPAFNQRMMTPGQPPFRSPIPVVPSAGRRKRFETNSDLFDEETMDRLNGRL